VGGRQAGGHAAFAAAGHQSPHRALLGDNGAGKSTLIKIISGAQRPDEGRLVIRGEETELRSVDHARSLGIDCVYQDLALVTSCRSSRTYVPQAREDAPPGAAARDAR
jgi:ABC-type sugar transport system ATPase subunit